MKPKGGKASLRCAIYTRVSTEHGLEQEFNSLDNQREASEAYIKSQAHEGWKLIRTRYDDGGYSGGSMDRPALQKLLDDVRARRIDVVVVYKVDRLTRSLADFAKLVELFDAHQVSFVSVTQSFNTTTSMGRLTLNVLLSFAQFEREVTGERIRDKIAASKKKGIWMLVSQRTQLLNALRGHLTEVGVIAPQGPRYARELAELIEACDETIPFEVCEALAPLVVQLRNLDEAIARLERTIAKLARKDETARRLMSIPGFGPITASAMAATIQDTSGFAGPREFAAFLGLTPKQNSSGGKQKLGRISKMGNRNLRKLLVVGAHAVLFHRKPHTDPLRMWAKKLIEKKPFKLVAVALANKMARIAFAILRGKTVYREIPA